MYGFESKVTCNNFLQMIHIMVELRPVGPVGPVLSASVQYTD